MMDEGIGGSKPSDRESCVEYASRVMEKVLAAAQPGAVFGPPVKEGNYTAITASEVTSGGGFGFGGGTGPAPAQAGSQPSVAPSGSGGGGWGGSSGRPVAVIVIGPDGVRIQPVIDVTKLAIVAITAWGAMAIAMRKMLKAGRVGAG